MSARRLRLAALLLALGATGPAGAQQLQWQELPRLELQGQYGGPLRDTLIQRLRDPDTGAICYLYLPISARHTPPTANSYVSYGPNAIGSISCVPGAAAMPPVPASRSPGP